MSGKLLKKMTHNDMITKIVNHPHDTQGSDPIVSFQADDVTPAGGGIFRFKVLLHST